MGPTPKPASRMAAPPPDLAQENGGLGDTKAYWVLNDARFH
ncbi:MAG: hypothetical protein OXC26_18275 [Albidovulum sp.]|nr:hypothetical protein [Albidovulum sp.]